MATSLVFNLAVLTSLVPVTLLFLRRDVERGWRFWALLAPAVAAPLVWAGGQMMDGWQTSLSITLWAAIASSLLSFAATSVISSAAWRLTPLLLPYLIILGFLASLFAGASGQPLPEAVPSGLIGVHIVVAVVIVGLLAVAASAALATFLQSRALKSKQPTRLTRILPAVIDSERLFERLLFLCEALLGLGVASGMATLHAETGNIFRAGHMTAFSLPAFVVIGMLLIGRRVCGVRGQIAARLVILSYVLVFLGYFGMKFVHQVLMA